MCYIECEIIKRENKIVNLPFNVILICIKPMFAPILAGSFSRENDLYGATISVEATCHPDPRRVTK